MTPLVISRVLLSLLSNPVTYIFIPIISHRTFANIALSSASLSYLLSFNSAVMERPKPVTRISNYDANGQPLLTFHLEQVVLLKQELDRLEQVDCIKKRLAGLEKERVRLEEERISLDQDLARLELPQDDQSIMDCGPPRLLFDGRSPIDDPSSPGGSPKVARQIELLRKLRAPPFKYAWNFYHDKHSNSGNYEGRLTLMKDEIITAKPFWEVLNSFPLERLQLKDSVHFFKRGVKPVWEDPRNVKGGSWTFRVPKAQAEQFWKEVLMMAVGEQFADVIQPGMPTPFTSPSATNPTS